MNPNILRVLNMNPNINIIGFLSPNKGAGFLNQVPTLYPEALFYYYLECQRVKYLLDIRLMI